MKSFDGNCNLKIGRKVRLVILSLLSFATFYLAVPPGTVTRRELHLIESKNDLEKTPPTIIFFFHVPKTGGETIRESMSFYGIKQRLRVTDDNTYRFFTEKLMSGWNDGTTKVEGNIFIEIHGSTNPQLFIQKLPEWRTSLASVGIKVFAFTMLREPLSWYISAFNFLCVQGTSECGETAISHNGLVDSASPNPQCSFFMHGWSIPFLEQDKDHPPVTSNECYRIRQQLKRNFDWVGTTENFEETMTVMRNRFPQIGKTIVKNKTIKKVRKHLPVLNSHKIRLENISSLDKAVYLDAQKYFIFKGDATKR